MFIVYSIIALLLCVAIHEMGHFLAARRYGVGVWSLAIGFGKVLYRRTLSSGLELRICMIPFGGYCEIMNKNNTEECVTDNGEKYYPVKILEMASLKERIVILLAGVVFNTLAATVTLLALNLATGTYTIDAKWLVGNLGPYGKMIGSAIVSPAAFLVTAPYEFFVAISTRMNEVVGSVAGPVGIVMMAKPEVTTVTATDQLAHYVMFFVFLNKVLAATNIIPLVPLDGGYIANALIGKVWPRRGPIVFGITTGMLLMTLFGFAFWNDGVKLSRIVGPIPMTLGLSIAGLLVMRAAVKNWRRVRRNVCLTVEYLRKALAP